MKKYILFPFLVAGCLMLGGCENNFEPKIFGSLLQGSYPSSESDYVSYAMGCYVPLQSVNGYKFSDGTQHGVYQPTGGYVRMFDTPTDMQAPGLCTLASGWLDFSKADFEPCRYYGDGSANDKTPGHYRKTVHVTRFTEIIGTLERAPENHISVETKTGLVAEARLCRANFMYFLLHVFGPVPVIVDYDKVFDESAQQAAVRPTLDQYCQWIYDDLEFAVKNVPEKQSEKGRYTRDFARYCMMRHCLNEGGHMEGWYKKGLEMYEELKGKYSLFTKGSNPYQDLFKNANKFNCEIIMAVSCDRSGINGGRKEGNINNFAWLVCPSNQSATDPSGNQTALYPQNGGWSPFFNISKTFYDRFDDSDLRKATIYTDYWTKQGVHITSADLGKRWDGYIPWKYPAEDNVTYQGTDLPIARWADVLLMYAELKVRDSKSAPDNDAINAVNQVRGRAGLGGLTPAQTASMDSFLDAILEERGKEFYLEGMRKIDLIRHNKYATLTSESKGVAPSRQYMPIPDYAVRAAESYGYTLEQFYSRPGWEQDKSNAQ